MYAYIKGKLAAKFPTHVVLETGGVGYHLHISLNTFSKIEHLNEACLQVALIVKEDSHTLFGFFDEDEKQLFLLLIGVSGVGSNTARIILSGMSTEEVRQAILSDQPAAFQRVKGIGPKTAKQIILDLKNKIEKNSALLPEFTISVDNKAVDEALSALLALGFQRPKASGVIQALRKSNPELQNAEQLIRAALSQLT
jgi:Holliday junction DNA helicase RuvA